MPRSFLAAVSLVLAVAAAGCGTTTIDASKAEHFLDRAITPRPRAVSCPRGVPVRAGHSFRCAVAAASGLRYTVTVHILDSIGHVRVSPGDVRLR